MKRPNVNTKIWGPGAWEFMHTIAFAYPSVPTDTEKRHAKQFFQSLPSLLPCNECRKHFKKMITVDNPLTDETVSDQEHLSKWLVGCHNLVNQRKGKTLQDYDDIKKDYEKILGTCGTTTFTDQELYIHDKKKFIQGWTIGSVIVILLTSIIYYLYIIRKIK